MQILDFVLFDTRPNNLSLIQKHQPLKISSNNSAVLPSMAQASVSSGAIVNRRAFAHSLTSLSVLDLAGHSNQTPARVPRLTTRGQGKGLGAGTRTTGRPAKGGTGKKSSFKGIEELKKINGAADQSVVACPCGGGEERKAYEECCGRYHGGVREPDAVTLMSESTAWGYNLLVVQTDHLTNTL